MRRNFCNDDVGVWWWTILSPVCAGAPRKIIHGEQLQVEMQEPLSMVHHRMELGGPKTSEEKEVYAEYLAQVNPCLPGSSFIAMWA